MKVVIIDGIEFQASSIGEVNDKFTFDIKVVALGGELGNNSYLVWSNIPNFELQGVKMNAKEFNSYCIIIGRFNYVRLQDLSPIQGDPTNSIYIRIFRYARILNP